MPKYFCILIMLFLLSCSFKQDIKPLQKATYHIIDLDGKREKRIHLSSIFKKEVKTIILETVENCLISDISNLQVFEDHFYILDAIQAMALLVFDRDGRFVRKIGNLGRGPGEYSDISDFTIDAENKHIYILDRLRVHKYHITGAYINTIEIKSIRVSANFIQYYGGKLYSDAYGYSANNGGYLLQEIDPENGKITAKFLELSYNKGWNETFFTGHSFFMNRLGTPRYSQLFTDTIVSLSGGVTPFIALKSNDLVTAKDIERLNSLKNEEIYPYARFNTLRKTTRIFDVNNYIELANAVIFDYRHGNAVKTVWYDIQTQKTRITDYLHNDLVYKDESITNIRHFSNGRGVYEVIDGIYFPDFLEIIKKGGLSPGLDKREELMRLTEDSNPVIFYYEAK
jgi:hypothetical protein